MKAMVAVHKLVLTFPDYERFAHTDQMRRASKSVPTNIAEGYGRRRSAKEFKHYLTMVLGSANEMIVHLEVTRELGYAGPDICNSLIEDYTVICKMLYRLIENWHTIPPASSKPPVRQHDSDI
ncbi:MAG: four helix bundle protein [Chloroflexi bacterium]|nr:four helix bundle protein [Chloroflexota bacterium]